VTAWILRIGAADERLLVAVALRRRPWLTRFMRIYTRFGDAPVPVGVAALLLLGAVPGLEGAGIQAAVSLALAFTVSQVLKRWISRPRPDLPVGLRFVIEPPDRFSFPSGHATASLAVALPVAMAFGGGLLLPLVLAPALLVGLSRCYLGVHYPGDVMAGWGIAVGSALVTMGVA
jgi:undecaprenyl-diphosphatase